MGAKETTVVNESLIAASKRGARLFKNIKGGAYPIQYVKPLIAAIMRGNIAQAKDIIKTMRVIMFGLLAPGSSDAIGYVSEIVTPEWYEKMKGKPVAIFSVVEFKTEIGAVQNDQEHFIDVVIQAGGRGGVARSAADTINILYPDNNA